MLGKQKVNDSEVLKFGFLGGMAEAVYVFLVASVITVLDKVMAPPPTGLVGPMFVLLLLVFSAGVSGILVFGYPAFLALQNRFSEGLMTALTTLVTIAIIGILVFILISII